LGWGLGGWVAGRWEGVVIGGGDWLHRDSTLVMEGRMRWGLDKDLDKG